jgi:hypothetical protein
MAPVAALVVYWRPARNVRRGVRAARRRTTPDLRPPLMTQHYVLTTDDADRWRAVLPADACVMGCVEYARICERHNGYSARLFVVESEGSVVAYPFFLRPVDGSPGRWDTLTPEYTGPLRIGPARGTAPALLSELFHRYCLENGIVAEFAHLNPWHAALDQLEPTCVRPNRDIVFVDLTWGEEQIWTKSLSSDARRQTKQAQKAGVRVRRARTTADVLDFHRLHEHTMERREALDRYFVPPEYFLAFHETLPHNSFFLLADYEGKAVAGGLYLEDRADVYWHLSAVDIEFSRVRPVNAYVHFALCEAVKQGKQRMCFGGGYQRDDGVFRFKANFSPLRAQFQTYARVHDEPSYDALTATWAASNSGRAAATQFFPAYRAPPAP